MSDELTGMQKLQAIQQELKAPKGQYNDHGNYKYRSCEDILTALKPFLLEHSLHLHITDAIEECAGRVFLKATVTLNEDIGIVSQTTSYAQHDAQRKGMDGSQISGACSSYARKYAINAMFLIDDVKDADTMKRKENTTAKTTDRTPVKQTPPKEGEWL